VAGAYAAYLVPPGLLGRATAITASGGSLASVLGGPIGNGLGQAFGWRWSFGVFAALGVVVLGLLAVLLPGVGGAPEADGPQARRHRVPGGVLGICVLLLVIVLSQSVFSTYLVPWLEDVAGFPSAAVPAYLLATGIAAAAGVAVMGVVADRRPRATLAGAATLVFLSLVVLPVVAGVGWLVVAVGCLMSASFGMLPPLLQAQLMRWSPEEVRALAVAIQTTAINVGIGGGALLGGVALRASLLPALPWLSAVGAGMVVVLGVSLRRRLV
jgi:predicted MFS family arabinose efflux permease